MHTIYASFTRTLILLGWVQRNCELRSWPDKIEKEPGPVPRSLATVAPPRICTIQLAYYLGIFNPCSPLAGRLQVIPQQVPYNQQEVWSPTHEALPYHSQMDVVIVCIFHRTKAAGVCIVTIVADVNHPPRPSVKAPVSATCQ